LGHLGVKNMTNLRKVKRKLDGRWNKILEDDEFIPLDEL
jgi:hypothetical protein